MSGLAGKPVRRCLCAHEALPRLCSPQPCVLSAQATSSSLGHESQLQKYIEVCLIMPLLATIASESAYQEGCAMDKSGTAFDHARRVERLV